MSDKDVGSCVYLFARQCFLRFSTLLLLHSMKGF